MLAQLAVLAATAWAASRMSASQFLLFGLVVSGASLLASCNTWGAELRVTVVEEQQAEALVRAGFTVLGTLTAVVTLVGGVALGAGHSWGLTVLLTGVGAFFTGVYQVLASIVLRRQRQEFLARYRLVQGPANAALIVLGILVGANMEYGLVVAWMLSLLIGALTMLPGVRGGLPSRLASADDLRFLTAQVRLQPVSSLLASSVSTLNLYALAAFGTASVAGAWALATRFLNPVVNTAYNTLQPIYVGSFGARLREQRPARAFYRRWVLGLAASTVAFTVGAVVLMWFVLPALGTDWASARSVVVPATVYFASMWLCLPVSQTLVMLGRVDEQFWWTVTRCVLCLAPLLFIPALGTMRALDLWAVAAALTFVAQLVWLNERALRAREPHAAS